MSGPAGVPAEGSRASVLRSYEACQDGTAVLAPPALLVVPDFLSHLPGAVVRMYDDHSSAGAGDIAVEHTPGEHTPAADLGYGGNQAPGDPLGRWLVRHPMGMDKAEVPWLVALGAHHGPRELHRAVAYHIALSHQDDPPPDAPSGWHSTHGFYGLGRSVLEAPNEVIDEIDAAIEAYMAEDGHSGLQRPDDGLAPASFAERRAEALLQITRVARCSAGDQLREGADRYQVHVVTDIERLAGGRGRAELASGIPIHSATLQMICPDATTITHVTASSGEPLYLGRLQRMWSRAQRRAIMVRDGARCRVPGCGARHCDIHHLRAWEHDGPTDIDNGAYICRRHHRAIHRGDIVVSGSANATLSFSRRDGTLIAPAPLRPNPTRLLT